MCTIAVLIQNCQATFNFFNFIIFKNIYLHIYFWPCWLFIAMQGLSLVAVSRGYFLVAVLGLLIGLVSLVVEHRL